MILGVNLDHVATLRMVRGGSTSYPDLIDQMNSVIAGGADQITVHLREDRRHIQDKDVFEIKKNCNVLLNLEMACTAGMLKIASRVKPDWVCLVPEKRRELTTEGGLDVYKSKAKIKRYVSQLQSFGIKVSLFVDPVIKQVVASSECEADAVELHTGKFVLAKKKSVVWRRLKASARRANELGLLVHAGHGLDFEHAKLIVKLPYLREVNIGHFLVCDALNGGLKSSVRKMKRILRTYS